MSLPRRLVPGLVMLLVTLVVAGCNYVETVPPSPSPADFQGVATELAKRGIKIDHVVSGDAGCTDKVLAPTARLVRRRPASTRRDRPDLPVHVRRPRDI